MKLHALKTWREVIQRNGLLMPVLAGGLAVLVVAEILVPGPAAPPPRAVPALQGDAAVIASDATITNWGNTILARPLLDPSRRAAPPPDSSADDSDSFTLPRLSAIIITQGTRSAVFSTPGEKPLLVAQGGQIGPYVLKSITPDHVEMSGPDGLSTLRPQFDTADSSGGGP